MKRKTPARRNPVARAVKTLRPQKVKSAKAYRRRTKHEKARPEIDAPDGLFFFAFCRKSRAGAFRPRRRSAPTNKIPYSAASGRVRMISMISAAAVGMLVPGP